jgi:hypothetical protein
LQGSVAHSHGEIDEAHVATALALRVGVHPQLSGDRL